MRKKLALFTLAVGFFTLCNVVLYTRRLRAEEMTRFWHWSTVVQPLASNCSGAFASQSLEDAVPCSGNGSSATTMATEVVASDGVAITGSPASSAILVSSSNGNEVTVASGNVTTRTQAPSTSRTKTESGDVNASTFSTDVDGLRSSATSRLVRLPLDDWKYAVHECEDGSVAVDVTLSSPNRTVRVTYNVPLLERLDVLVWERRTTADPVASPIAKDGALHPTYHVTTPPGQPRGVSALNEHRFGYLINVEDLCRTTSGLALVVLVTTAVNHFAQRKAIRDTWGGFAQSQPDVRLAFVMGHPGDATVQAAVVRESLQFADILQEDFADTYRNLSLKSAMLLKWAHTFCPKARFVMKSDDDMFINVPNLLKYIQSLRGDRRQLFGRLVRGARPVRSKSSKYFAPISEYKDNVYPDYLSGTAYVMSADVAAKLFNVSQLTPLFFLEDVFITGICAKKAGIARRNHTGFVYYKRPVKGCAYYKVISGHNNSPNDLRLIWKDLQKKNLKC